MTLRLPGLRSLSLVLALIWAALAIAAPVAKPAQAPPPVPMAQTAPSMVRPFLCWPDRLPGAACPADLPDPAIGQPRAW